MKAITYTEYGPPEVLHLAEVNKPVPGPNELLIRNRATSINFGDLTARRFNDISPREFNMPLLFWVMARLAFGWRKPRKAILGSEFAGEVAAAGPEVTSFKVGDLVFGYTGQRLGADAEYLVVPEDGMVAHKPANMSYPEAAVVPYGATTALNLLRKAPIERGQKVLIIGASGSIGSAAVQLARHYGAEVTGVCSTPRVPFVQALGADKVIDYTQEDFSESGETYDLILDVLGRGSFAQLKDSLNPHGRYLLASFKMKQIAQMLWSSVVGSKKVICALAPEKAEDLRTIKELIEAGALKAVIDQCFPLEETAAAHRYVEQGHKKGHIALVI